MKFFSMNLFRSFQYLFVTLLLCFGVEFQTYAQYYPIHATVQWPSPQSPYLSDYYSGSRDRLIVTLLNRDLQQPLLFAKLRVKLKSTGFLATTREEQIYPMLELNANVPTRLTNLDLAPYLQPQNLQSSGSLRNGQLPTGYTEFSVQVVDYYTGRQLSAWHTGRSYLDIKKPPLLHSPEKDAQIGVLDPLFLRFQWMPRHQGVSGTEYEFVLKELPDNGVAPQSAFLYGQEIYRIRTRSTSLNYTHLEPLLLPNRRYAWQVQALARDGVEEVGMFENGGFSEINWFYLNDNCQSPTGLKSIPRFAKVDLSWQKVMGTTGYVVECRPKTKLNTYEWSRTQVGGERLTLGGLKPGWAYEWRVGTLCTDVRPVFSPVYEFTLSSENEELLADCGKQPAGHDLSREPNLRVKAGDVITIGGDYPMTLTEVTSLGDGWYFGRGKTRLKSVVDASVALRFDRLRINVDNYQIDGQVEASYDEKKGKIANVDYIDDGGLDLKPATLRIREHPLDFTLPDIPVFTFNPVTGSLETTDVNGHAQRIQIELPTNESYESVFPLLVTDEKGQSYQVGRVEEPSSAQGAEPAHGEASAPLRLVSERVVRVGDFNTESLTSRHGYVRFERGEGKYAFDSGEEKWYQHSVKVDRFYKPFSKGYVAPWKLVPVGEQDVIEARYEGQKRIDLTKVLFVSEPHAAAIPAQLNESDQSWKIQLRSVSSGSCYDVFAVYEGEVIGKLRVASYEKQQHKVVLVPMNDAAIDKSGIEEELKLIYAPVGIEFRVEVDERLRKNSSWDLADKDGKLSLIGDSFWGIEKELKLTEEMRRLHDLYTGLEDAHDGAVIFLLDGSKGLTDTKGSLLGEMPRKSRFGYVFSQDGANIGHTIAHELGHGLFTLQHTFDKEYGGKKSQGATRNLMDYNFGKELAAFQWNVMSAPAIFTKMDKVEEGKDVLVGEYLIESNNGVAPDGRVLLSWESLNPDYKVIATIQKSSTFINGFELHHREKVGFKQSFVWNGTTYASGTTIIENSPDIRLTYNTATTTLKTTLYRTFGDKCTYQSAEVSYDPVKKMVLTKNPSWKTEYLWNASASCKAEFIKDLLEADSRCEGPNKADQDLLSSIKKEDTPEQIVEAVHKCCLQSLRALPFEKLSDFIVRIASQKSIKNESELAILRLMNALDGEDYAQFYQLLEADNNKLLIHLIDQMDDLFGFRTKSENYTNFMGALVWMFNSDFGHSTLDRWPLIGNDYAQRVVNMDPIVYIEDRGSHWFEPLQSTKHNKGEYDATTGMITLYDVYTTYDLEPLPENSTTISKTEHSDFITTVSPFTPILIVPNKEKLSLIHTALGENNLSGELYLVPAIFLKYNNDKIRNDYIEKGVFTTLDIATIALSGGTALSTKVNWIRRAWALAEVVGSVGNIAVNTQTITHPKVKEAVDIYNLAMGAIGLKNIGVQGYKFVKNLPEHTQELLQRNEGLKNFLLQKNKEWSNIVNQLEHIDEPQKQLLAYHKKVWDFVLSAPKVVGKEKLHLVLSRSQKFNKFLNKVRIKRTSVSLDEFTNSFVRLYEHAPANSMKSLDDVIDDFIYLMEHHLDDFIQRGNEQQMVNFVNEMMQTSDKFKVAATSLEVIKNKHKYIPERYCSSLKHMELEDLIAYVDEAGEFRFDIKWKVDGQSSGFSVFVDTKNYASASSMFQDLGQFKAYLKDIESFDQLYIIQQGGRGVTKEQIIARLKNAIANDAEEVFDVNQNIWKNLDIKDASELKQKCIQPRISTSDKFQQFINIIQITQ